MNRYHYLAISLTAFGFMVGSIQGRPTSKEKAAPGLIAYYDTLEPGQCPIHATACVKTFTMENWTDTCEDLYVSLDVGSPAGVIYKQLHAFAPGKTTVKVDLHHFILTPEQAERATLTASFE